MTIQAFLEDRLFQNCLWPEEAKQIVEQLYKTLDEDMQQRWQDQIEDYPKPFWAVLWLRCSTEAIEWLKENKPNHFALFVLEGQFAKRCTAGS